jgi:hypothetical protein
MQSHAAPAHGSPDSPPLLLFGATIFVGAFLLFLIQPLMAKYILPWYGGSPAVWTTCMLFFQSFLLLGYVYAHWLTSRLTVRTQAAVHLTLLAIALFFLPVVPAEHWKPAGSAQPVAGILAMLAVCLGLPYALLAATSPLLQRWFTVIAPGRVPYRFFALSNVGSFLALLAYPFLAEPLLSRSTQAVVWSWGMGVYALLCVACLAFAYRSRGAAVPLTAASAAVPWRERWLWLALPATASVLLLAVTNKLCQDVAVVPFLWVTPLLIYLLSFVLCFDRPAWYSRPAFGALFLLACAAVSVLPFWRGDAPVALSMAAYAALLFAGCMLCHGELYRRRPSVEGLTMYYLTIAAGGALGGVAVVIVAPALFSDYAELTIGTLLCAFFFLFVLYREPKGRLSRGRPRWAWALLCLAFAAYAIVQQGVRSRERQFTIANSRNFYGTLKVAEYDATRPADIHRTMRHGAILHGLQYLAPRFQPLPTAYYTEKSGVGYCLRYYPSSGRRKIGIVGLGVGTLAAWGAEGDTVRFYEINPAVTELAATHFTYLKRSPAVIDIVEGDARLSLEGEEAQMFDILILDAFNSDSPPVHLLTREAFAIYRRHLKPGGAIAINMTCKYLNFFPVVARMAEECGFRWAYIFDPNTEDAFYRSSSTWMVLSENEGLMGNSEFLKVCSRPRMAYRSSPVWTDDYAPLASILAW